MKNIDDERSDLSAGDERFPGAAVSSGSLRSGRRSLSGVAKLNLGLAAGLVLAIVGYAGAQSSETRRVGGQYICVGGATSGGYTNVIYVLDTANREVVALRWNDGTKQLDGVGYRDLVEDLTKENDR
ncbi:MAG: hypothetical protein AB8C13_01475 [Phycisphaerales bacterium]